MYELVLENSTQVALIDDEDEVKVNGIKWYVNKKTGYVYGYFGYNKKIYLHRFILDNLTDEQYVDHIDRNPLNNCKVNLRICSNMQNSHNRKGVHATSKYKGVSWEKRVNKWRVTINYNYKQKHIGTFDNEIDAAKAYNRAAKEMFGEFCLLNEV